MGGAVVLIAAGALVVSMVLGDAPDDNAIELVPADAAFYATVHLDPSLGQKRATQEVLDRVREAGAGDGSAESLEDAVGSLLTDSTSVDYETDMKPHVGDQLAIYARAGEPAALVMATEDPSASRRAMHRMLEREYPGDYYRLVRDSYRGEPYEHVVDREYGDEPSGTSAFAVLDGFVVAGGEEEVRDSIAAADGDSLGDTDRYAEARGKLSDDVLAAMYVDGERLLDEARASSYPDSEEVEALEALADVGPSAATLTAVDGRLELDLAGRAASGEAAPLQRPAALLRGFPAEAIAAISFGDLQGPMRVALDGFGDDAEDLRDGIADVAELDADADVATWLGSAGGYLAGSDSDSVQGAIVAETKSPAESDRALDQIEDHYTSLFDYSYDDYVYASDDGLGFDLYTDGDTVSVRGDADRVIVGMGAEGLATERALDAAGGFGESELYRRSAALLGGFEPFMTIDVAAVQRLLEDATEISYDDTYMEDVRGWLSTVSIVATGVQADGEDVRIRVVAETG